jgi:release factor glutamine methyltransferase
MNTLAGLHKELTAALTRAGVDAPAVSVRLLAAHVLGLRREELLTRGEMGVPADKEIRLRTLVERRAAGEPVAYLLGEREFYGRSFKVGPDVLIPRPETEILVEAALKAVPRERELCFADLGTGSGALGVTRAAELPLSRGVLVDTSRGALSIARENARRHGVEARLEFVEADFGQPLLGPGVMNLIVANPPYVSTVDYDALDPEVRCHEPAAALVGGPRGDECYPALVRQACLALASGGWLAVEIGCDQAESVVKIFENECLTQISAIQDLAGLDRVVVGRKAEFRSETPGQAAVLARRR